MIFQFALAGAEHMHCQTAHHVADELAAMAGLASNHLDRHALPREDQDRVARHFPTQLICVPQALGTDQLLGIDRRTASRKAASAFSIRCQRSAVWTASGRARVVASP